MAEDGGYAHPAGCEGISEELESLSKQIFPLLRKYCHACGVFEVELLPSTYCCFTFLYTLQLFSHSASLESVLR